MKYILFAFSIILFSACKSDDAQQPTAPTPTVEDPVAPDDTVDVSPTIETPSTTEADTAPESELTVEPQEPQEVVGMLLLPGAGTGRFTISSAMSQMEKLKENLEEDGYRNVVIVEYPNDLTEVTRVEMEDQTIAALNAAMTTPGRYIVVGHSMGHYAGLAAILRGGLSARVSNFIGLAGAGRGAEELPSGCSVYRFGDKKGESRCPATKGLIINEDDYVVNNLIAANQGDFDSLAKCSIAVEDDRVLKPADSGFFPGGTNVYVDYGAHTTLPSQEELVETLKSECGI